MLHFLPPFNLSDNSFIHSFLTQYNLKCLLAVAIINWEYSVLHLKNYKTKLKTLKIDSIPGSRRLPWRRDSNIIQYSCLENSMDRGAWWLQSTGLQRVGHNWSEWTQHKSQVKTLLFPELPCITCSRLCLAGNLQFFNQRSVCPKIQYEDPEIKDQ